MIGSTRTRFVFPFPLTVAGYLKGDFPDFQPAFYHHSVQMNSVELLYQFAFTHLLVKGLRSPLLSSFPSMLSGTVSLATDIPWMVGECLCSWIVCHVTMFLLQMVKCIVNYRLHTTREKITAWTQATFYIFYGGKVGFLNVWLESSRISTWIIMYNYCVVIIRHIISFVLTNVH